MSSKIEYAKVVSRNFSDLTLTLVTPANKHVVNFVWWIESSDNPSLSSLPHSNAVVSIHNLKLIRTIQSDNHSIHYYFADADSTLIEDVNPQHDFLDDLISCAHLLEMDSTGKSNLLNVVQENGLKPSHLYMLYFMPDVFPSLKIKGNLNYAIFKGWAESGLIKDMRLSLKQEIILQNNIFKIYTPCSLMQTVDVARQLTLKDNVPYFGNYFSKAHECLVGILTSYLGKLCLEDKNCSLVVHVSFDENARVLKFINCLVLITKYHVVTESYYDGIAECLLVSPDNVQLLCSDVRKLFRSDEEPTFYEKYGKLPLIESMEDVTSAIDDSHKYRFTIEAIAPLSKVPDEDDLQAWLLVEVIVNDDRRKCFLALRDSYLAVVALLDVGKTYQLYSGHPLEPGTYCYELHQYDSHYERLQLKRPGAFFHVQPGRTDVEILTQRPDAPGIVNIVARLTGHFLNDSRSFRKAPECSYKLGMLARKFEHKLSLIFENGDVAPLYLNQWEWRQTPEGLHPNVYLQVTHVQFTGSYFRTTCFTNVKTVGVGDVLTRYETVNSHSPDTYESIALPTHLGLQYYMFLRTRVYVIDCQGVLYLNSRRLQLRFDVRDYHCVHYNLSCTRFELLFKLMEITDEKLLDYYMNHNQFRFPIPIADIDFITQDVKIRRSLPLLTCFVQHMHYKLTNLVMMDVLVKKLMNGTWIIVDVYGVH